MPVTSCYLLLLHLFLQNLKHTLIYETQNETLDKDPYNPWLYVELTLESESPARDFLALPFACMILK